MRRLWPLQMRGVDLPDKVSRRIRHFSATAAAAAKMEIDGTA